MLIEYHPAVRHDVAEAMGRYKTVSIKLADDFREELRSVIALAARNPKRFRLVKRGFHRANLKRFPYHFIYLEIPKGIRVMLIRHHRRHPDHGMERQ